MDCASHSIWHGLKYIVERMVNCDIICLLKMCCGELWMIPHMLNCASHLIWYGLTRIIMRMVKYICILIDMRNVRFTCDSGDWAGQRASTDYEIWDWAGQRVSKVAILYEKYERVRSKTELDRESQEWPFVYKKYKIMWRIKQKWAICKKCVTMIPAE